MVNPQTVRRFIMTASVTAITVTGALSGAQLKTDVENAEQRKRAREIPYDEMIAQLERAKEDLMTRIGELERKIEHVDERKTKMKEESKALPRGRG